MGNLARIHAMHVSLTRVAVAGLLVSCVEAFFQKQGVADAAPPAHPVLPLMWTATVKEDEVGVVYESENQVHWHEETTAANPSAKWTNFTDGSCMRLIYSDDKDYDHSRYLLKCDALDCCTEDSEAPLEYQIPNVHPAFLTHVISLGKRSLSLFDGSSVTADAWSWTFGPENITAFTTPNPSNSSLGVLHQWTAKLGDAFVNQYVNYTAVPEADKEAFRANFYVPDVCKGAMKCGDAHRLGKLSEKSLRFLRAGKFTHRHHGSK